MMSRFDPAEIAQYREVQALAELELDQLERERLQGEIEQLKKAVENSTYHYVERGKAMDRLQEENNRLQWELRSLKRKQRHEQEQRVAKVNAEYLGLVR